MSIFYGLLQSKVNIIKREDNDDTLHLQISYIDNNNTDSAVRIWLGPDLWIDELCKKLTRNMSRKEWRDSVSKDIDYIEQCPRLPIPPDAPEAAANN